MNARPFARRTFSVDCHIAAMLWDNGDFNYDGMRDHFRRRLLRDRLQHCGAGPAAVAMACRFVAAPALRSAAAPHVVAAAELRLAVTLQGFRLASGSHDGLRMWDTGNGKPSPARPTTSRAFGV